VEFCQVGVAVFSQTQVGGGGVFLQNLMADGYVDASLVAFEEVEAEGVFFIQTEGVGLCGGADFAQRVQVDQCGQHGGDGCARHRVGAAFVLYRPAAFVGALKQQFALIGLRDAELHDGGGVEPDERQSRVALCPM